MRPPALALRSSCSRRRIAKSGSSCRRRKLSLASEALSCSRSEPAASLRSSCSIASLAESPPSTAVAASLRAPPKRTSAVAAWPPPGAWYSHESLALERASCSTRPDCVCSSRICSSSRSSSNCALSSLNLRSSAAFFCSSIHTRSTFLTLEVCQLFLLKKDRLLLMVPRGQWDRFFWRSCPGGAPRRRRRRQPSLAQEPRSPDCSAPRRAALAARPAGRLAADRLVGNPPMGQARQRGSEAARS
mmetsp:Transcript_13529/g.34372  ORF Transcript_13529/g.34372 Transcript_13529/m.34372 type:complete len:245 (-) Transcript_13529:32-766(-)